MPHVQGQRSPSKTVGAGAAAVRCWRLWGDTPCPRAKERPQLDKGRQTENHNHRKQPIWSHGSQHVDHMHHHLQWFWSPQNKVCHCLHCFHRYLPWSDGTEAMILVFWTLSFKPAFSLFSFTFIKRLFSSSSFSAIRVVSSAYLRLLIFLPEILIPACASSSPAFHMMYSAYKLNKQGDNIQPWRFPFLTWNQSVFLCPVLTVASWPAYRFLKRQVRWSGIPTSLRIFQFVVIHTIKGFGVVNKAEVDVFFEVSCFFDDPTDVGNLISGSSHAITFPCHYSLWGRKELDMTECTYTHHVIWNCCLFVFLLFLSMLSVLMIIIILTLQSTFSSP